MMMSGRDKRIYRREVIVGAFVKATQETQPVETIETHEVKPETVEVKTVEVVEKATETKTETKKKVR